LDTDSAGWFGDGPGYRHAYGDVDQHGDEYAHDHEDARI
jgi:hypothetical protein